MVGPRVAGVAVGTGQPTRTDFEGRAHEQALRPGHQLDIPRQTIGQSRNQPRNSADPRAGSGWQRSERAYDAGDRQHAGGRAWGDFSEGRRGPKFGAVQIDAPAPPPSQPAQAAALAGDWAQHAATFEERFRADGERVGVDSELRLPGEGPRGRNARRRSAPNGRRAFTLKHG